MDSLIAFYKKNTAALFVTALLLPLALALVYSSVRSIWLKRKAKENSAAIYDYLLKSGADLAAQTTDAIAKALTIPKNDVIELCSLHPNIEDAGKRQRSWKIKSESTELPEDSEKPTKKKNR